MYFFRGWLARVVVILLFGGPCMYFFSLAAGWGPCMFFFRGRSHVCIFLAGPAGWGRVCILFSRPGPC